MELLTQVRIPEQAKKYPGQLSGGQQQRWPSPGRWRCSRR